MEGTTIHQPFFVGANLTAILKNDGGSRPITVGYMLHRLVTKVVGSKIMEEILAPRQLWVGVRGGTEAVVHATRVDLV